KLFKKRCGRGCDRLARLFLDIERFHHAVFDDGRIALRAHTEATAGKIDIETGRLGEDSASIGEKEDLAFAAGALGPCAHDEWIVYRHDGDLIDALGKDSVAVFEIAWQMIEAAGRGEGARNGKEN